jgi:ferredoxin
VAEIRIDESRCTSPRECRRCLEVCPEGVFMIFPRRPREPGIAANDWVIMATHVTQCTGCSECAASCPQAAISVCYQPA